MDNTFLDLLAARASDVAFDLECAVTDRQVNPDTIGLLEKRYRDAKHTILSKPELSHLDSLFADEPERPVPGKWRQPGRLFQRRGSAQIRDVTTVDFEAYVDDLSLIMNRASIELRSLETGPPDPRWTRRLFWPQLHRRKPGSSRSRYSTVSLQLGATILAFSTVAIAVLLFTGPWPKSAGATLRRYLKSEPASVNLWVRTPEGFLVTSTEDRAVVSALLSSIDPETGHDIPDDRSFAIQVVADFESADEQFLQIRFVCDRLATSWLWSYDGELSGEVSDEETSSYLRDLVETAESAQ